MKKTLAFALIAQAISVTLLLILAFNFFKQLNIMSSYTDDVVHTYRVLNQISVARSYIKDAETSVRGYLLTGQPEFLTSLERAKVSVFPAFDSLRQLVKDSASQLARLTLVETDARFKLELLIENIHLREQLNAITLNKRLTAGRIIMERLEGKLDEMRGFETSLLVKRSELKERYENLLPGKVRIFFLFTGLLTFLFGLWIYIELTKRIKYQALLQNKVRQLRQNNEELEQIAFAASHDLQEPLRKIRIFSDRLLDKTVNDTTTENYLMTERINVAATRLQGLISDLVTFNNLVQNKLESGKVSLKKVLLEAVSMARQNTPNMEILIDEEELPLVIGSEPQIQLLFQNLLNNCIAFCSPGRPLKVSIEISKLKWSQLQGRPGGITSGNYIYVKLTDNGLGFDETFKDKMFMPFQRLHNREEAAGGRRKGMGLAMCKRIMLNIGGWIDATGKVGEGAVIHLYFPVA